MLRWARDEARVDEQEMRTLVAKFLDSVHLEDREDGTMELR
jgi:hypothetical protein